MFVRKKPNKQGSVSVQIIDKSDGKYKVVKTVGCSSDQEEIDSLVAKANRDIPVLSRQYVIPLIPYEDKVISSFFKSSKSFRISVIGPELVFGKLFDRIGFNKIKDELFRHLVITRLAYPGSKLRTVDYLKRYRGIEIDVSRIYRFMDVLNETLKTEVEDIAFQYTKKVLNDNISVVFYDMTTLYFEAEDEDDLRRIGYSKDGKFQCPQIMIGLLVGPNGYPIGYDIFEGNTFEGDTLIPVLEKFQKKFNLTKPTVIADAGLLSKDNLEKLAAKKYQYILGGRIKNEKHYIKEKILKLNIAENSNGEIQREDGVRLVVTHSSQRAKKDEYSRTKGLEKLEAKIRGGKMTKQQINNRGYNKYLKLEGEIDISIDYDKIPEDKRWDGLKGYLTNTDLTADEIVKNYTNLWQIEKAFRISKTDLKVRPIFHRVKRRIEAHVCIAFVAYAIYKDLERILYKHKAPFSVKRACDLSQTIYELRYDLPNSKNQEKITAPMDVEQEILYEIIEKS